jgi:hypothetical protein
VHDVEGSRVERQLLAVRDAKREAGSILPRVETLDVDCDHVADAVAEQARDSAVPTADVEQRLVAAKGVAELVETALPIAKLAVQVAGSAT